MSVCVRVGREEEGAHLRGQGEINRKKGSREELR